MPESAETSTIAVLRGDTVGGAPGSIVEPLAAGTRVGRYVVGERIGRGGMGLVYAARDPDLDRVIALKVLRTDTREPASAVQQRMLREARALARLSHPNIVRIFDVGVVDDDALSGPRVWLAMELVDGGTLSEWLARSRRSLAEILAVFVAAGDALATAHAAGIVHRDFKPGNVLVGKDDAPRVVDFGLALAVGETLDDASTIGEGTANKDLRVTTTGMIMGTPAYMAPEQHLGSGADACSDQFAFAVTLWEALYGARPFAGERREDLSRSVVRCVLPKPPAGSDVPPRIHTALVRALQREPSARWPDMASLVGALAPKRRALARTTLGAAAVVLGIGGLAAWLDVREPPCTGGEAHMVDVWDEPRADAVAAAFAASDRNHATDSWVRVRERLDAQRDAWLAMHREACEASHGEEAAVAERALDLRMACLERRRIELRALVDVLVSADGDVVDRALGSALRLSPVDRCADVDALANAVVPPDPAIVGEVERLRAALADAEALSDSGRYEQAHAILGEVEPAARALGYAPLHAEALHRLGVVEVALGRPEDGARAHEEAAYSAQANHHDELVADAATALVYVLGFTLARRDEALSWGEHASSALDRIGDDPVRRAVLLGHIGLVYERAGDYPAAVEHDERALATWHELAGEDLPDAARVKNSLGNVLFRQGEVERARALWTSAHATFVATLGPDHPDIALPLSNLATSDLHLGNDAEAERRLLEVVAIWERALGPDHPRLATPLNNLAVIERDRGDYAASDALERRTLRIREQALGPDHTDVAMSLGGLAYSAWKQGRLADAQAQFRRAIAIRERAQGPEHPELAASLSNLALVQSEMGEHDAAIVTAERSMSIREKAFGVHNVEVANSLHALAVVLETAGRPADAVPVVERALRLRETAEHIDTAELAELRVALADLVTPQDPARAAALMQQARTEYVELGDTVEVANIDAWLAEHVVAIR